MLSHGDASSRNPFAWQPPGVTDKLGTQSRALVYFRYRDLAHSDASVCFGAEDKAGKKGVGFKGREVDVLILSGEFDGREMETERCAENAEAQLDS